MDDLLLPPCTLPLCVSRYVVVPLLSSPPALIPLSSLRVARLVRTHILSTRAANRRARQHDRDMRQGTRVSSWMGHGISMTA